MNGIYHFATFFLLYTLSTYAFAIKGKYAAKEEELASSCKLVFQIWDNEKKKALNGLCSASFIGKKSFLTSKHCFGDTAQAIKDHTNGKTEAPYFQCPEKSTKYSLASLINIDSAGFDTNYDLGIIKVSKEVEIPEIKLPTSSLEVEELLKDKSKCFINGYGYDNDGKYGVLKAAQVIEMDTNPLQIDIGAAPSIRIRKNVGVHGDSGGPMYCRTKDGPKLVGLIYGKKAGDVEYTDINRIDKVTDWINYHLNNENSSNDIFRQLRKLSERCEAVETCFTKLESAAKLSKEMSSIIKKLNEEVLTMKISAQSGESHDQKKIDQKWDQIIDVWEKNDCYKVLYP